MRLEKNPMIRKGDIMNKNKFDCDSTGMWCYDCPYRYCHLENKKYEKLKMRTEDHIKEGLYWISIDFENTDEVSQRAFARYKKWLEAEKGCVGCEPSYKEWILWNKEDIPESMKSRIYHSYHTGTFYFHPKRKEEVIFDV